MVIGLATRRCSVASLRLLHVLVYIFFQAEDGIRDIGVTGVQTCALPIYRPGCLLEIARILERDDAGHRDMKAQSQNGIGEVAAGREAMDQSRERPLPYLVRSEESSVGKECRSRWSPYH